MRGARGGRRPSRSGSSPGWSATTAGGAGDADRRLRKGAGAGAGQAPAAPRPRAGTRGAAGGGDARADDGRGSCDRSRGGVVRRAGRHGLGRGRGRRDGAGGGGQRRGRGRELGGGPDAPAWFEGEAARTAQGGGDLGDRLARAAQRVLAEEP